MLEQTYGYAEAWRAQRQGLAGLGFDQVDVVRFNEQRVT